MRSEHVSYSKEKTPPKTEIGKVKPKALVPFKPKAPDFSIPIDKVFINIDKRLEFILPTEIDYERLPFLKSFSSKPEDSFRFEYDGFKISTYRSVLKTQVQINPTQFDSFEGLNEWLKVYLDRNFYQHRVTKLHAFIDVPFSLEAINKALVIHGPRKSKKYAITETRKLSSLGGLKFTKKFGSEQYRQDAIYDSSIKHGLEAPSTRLEVQYNRLNGLGIRWWDDVKELLKLKPFQRYSLEELVEVHELKPSDKAKHDHLLLLVEKYGRHEALARLRSTCPGHFKAKYGRVLEHCSKPMSAEFEPLFESRLKDFLERDITEREQTFIQLFRNAISTSKFS